MRKRWTNIVLFLATTSGMAIACTSGTGPFAVFGEPYDRPPDSRDKPVDTRDTPPSSFDTPPVALDDPGTFGGGPASAATACPPCDVKFACLLTSGTKTDTKTYDLKLVEGKCVVGGTGEDLVVLECGGKLTVDGQPVGTWKVTSETGLTGNASVTDSKGATTTMTCVQKAQSTTPTPTGTVTVTPTPTPVPTTTATVPKPTDGGTTIIDAGTKG